MSHPSGAIEIPIEIGSLTGEIVGAEVLQGGLISLTRRLFTYKGTFVLKQSPNPPAGMYRLEAESLEVLSRPGGPRVPSVIAVDEHFLLLEDIGPKREPPKGFWRRFGIAIAHLHEKRSDRFGFQTDNYLGRLLMSNAWTADGHEFFIQNRMLRFLSEPLCEELLSAQDRKDIETLAGLIRGEVPSQPACLLHGDLWPANMACDERGEPAMFDPGCYYGWAEAELSMPFHFDVPREFFDAYREAHSLEPGWEDRFGMLHVRELLSMVAHCGDEYGSVQKLRALLERFVG